VLEEDHLAADNRAARLSAAADAHRVQALGHLVVVAAAAVVAVLVGRRRADDAAGRMPPPDHGPQAAACSARPQGHDGSEKSTGGWSTTAAY